MLKALTSNTAADAYTQIQAAGAGHSTYLLGYQNGSAFLYLASDAAAAGGNNDGAWQVAEIVKRCDFVSVGSNDLTQYMLAVDRMRYGDAVRTAAIAKPAITPRR